MQREARQRYEIVQGPLLENAFIQQQQDLSQPAIEPTTATRTGDVHRKREVVALARLRATADRREMADQAKFDAAIAKLKEEEEKIKLSAEKKKQELLAKKQAAKEKKKAALEQKIIAAEERKKTSEEKKLKSLQEKHAMADKRKEGMERRRKEMEEAKQLKAQERERIAAEKRRVCNTKFAAEEAMFLIHQADEFDRQQDFLQIDKEAHQTIEAIVEEERMNACQTE
ncbi:hypothetical protein ZWY2020_028588 [Hordeum vulgare]|nr:hypothetical protein ZWY2020_028588 [Hordeum vulgare]